MLVMRLQRVGRKNDPSFRVIVTEKERAAKAGRFIELVGFYNPRTKVVDLKVERIQYWLSKGVQPSGTIHNLLVSKNIIQAPKIHVSSSSKRVAAISANEKNAVPEVPVAA